MDSFLAYCVQPIWLLFVSFVCSSDAEITGKVFAPIPFKWLCAWIWPPLKFTVRTSETRDMRILFRKQFSC